MRTAKPTLSLYGIAIATIVAAVPSHAADESRGPVEAVRITLKLNDSTIEGSQERAARLQGKSSAEREAILDEALPRIALGAKYKMAVFVFESDSVPMRDRTNSGQVDFEVFGCLTIIRPGVLVVEASASCDLPNYPALWIVFRSPSGVPLNYNEYLFRATR